MSLRSKLNQLLFTPANIIALGMFAVSPISMAGSKSVEVAERIQVGSHMAVSGQDLCQDGRYIYFKSESLCERANRESGIPEYFECEFDLFAGPIREMEELKLDAKKSVFRYFTIPTEFTVQIFKGERQVAKRKRQMPLCDGRPVQSAETVVIARAELSPDLRKLLIELDSQGLGLIESPRGEVERIASITDPATQAPQGVFQLKSPLCNPEARAGLIAAGMSGGESSGGWSRLNPEDLKGIGRAVTVNRNDRPSQSPGFSFDAICETETK